MLWKIAQREFLDQFKSARFAIGLILAVSVTLGVTVIATDDYEQRLKDYHAAPKALEISWSHPRAFHRPSPFSILAVGDEVRLGNRVDISYRTVPLRPKSYSGGQGQDPFLESGMWSMDFVFVVKAIMSLMVLFLMYDAIASENERGTLQLVLSGSLGRGVFLSGKLLGGLVSTLVMFVLCAMVAALLIVQSPAIELDTEGAIRLIAIFGTGYLCLAAYCAVGLLISTAFKRSPAALLVSILVWVIAVGLLPGLCIELSRFISPLPSQIEMASRVTAARESIQAKLEKAREEFHRAFEQAIKEGKRTPDDARLPYHDLTIERSRLMWHVNQDYLNRMFRQRRTSLALMALSPSMALEAAASALAGTDAVAIEYFMTFARKSAEDYGQFIRLQITDRKNWSRDQMPVFQEQVESTADAFGRAIGFLLAPLVLFALCFIASQLIFSRYEVMRA